MTGRLATIEGSENVDLVRRLWRIRQSTTTSVFAIAAVAAAALMPVSARAADCAADVNPSGSKCETSTGKEITLDNNPNLTYNNIGILDNLVADGVKLDDPNAVFTNTGTFNNNFAGALNFSNTGTFVNNGIFNNLVTGAIVFNAAGTFTNNGTFNSSATGGIDFQSAGTINNSGTFNDTSANSFTSNGNAVTFNNNAGSIFNAFGGTIDLGTGTFTNAGTMNLGGSATIGNQTAITGNYVQTDTGTLRLRTNWGAGIADNLNVGTDATLAGKVAVSHTNITGGALTQSYTIVTNGGTLTDGGLTVANTATISNSLLFGANTVTLNSTINFLGNGAPITGNPAAVARAINTLFTGGASLPFVTAMLNITSTAQYVQALQSLGPVLDSGAVNSMLATSATFSNQLLSCRVAGEGDSYAVIREGQCAWARMTGRRTDVNNSATAPGGTESAMLMSTGAQFKVSGPWRVGVGIGYEEPTSKNSAWISETRRVHLGGVVKYNPGPWLFALGVNGGWGSSDNTRFIAFPGFSSVAKSSNDSEYISGRFTTAYLMPLGNFYLKPQFDISQTSITRDAYSESATAGGALSVQGTSLSVWSYSPSIEIGSQFQFANNSLVRPYAKIGGTWRDRDTLSTTASFAGAGLGGTSFSMVSQMDKSFLDIGSGVDMIMPGDTVIRLQYDGQYGDTTTAHSGSAKFSVKF